MGAQHNGTGFQLFPQLRHVVVHVAVRVKINELRFIGIGFQQVAEEFALHRRGGFHNGMLEDEVIEVARPHILGQHNLVKFLAAGVGRHFPFRQADEETCIRHVLLNRLCQTPCFVDVVAAHRCEDNHGCFLLMGESLNK